MSIRLSDPKDKKIIFFGVLEYYNKTDEWIITYFDRICPIVVRVFDQQLVVCTMWKKIVLDTFFVCCSRNFKKMLPLNKYIVRWLLQCFPMITLYFFSIQIIINSYLHIYWVSFPKPNVNKLVFRYSPPVTTTTSYSQKSVP